MIITQLRSYSPEYTQSELFINNNDKRFCYVLEDKRLPWGIKVTGETCIPEGAYQVINSISRRLGKPMPLLFNTIDMAVERDGVKFDGIRVHGGNDVHDTAGCPIVAYNTDHGGRVWGSASDEINAEIDAAINSGEWVLWVITSL
jgi:Family of unknown function (DUF5675)